MTQKKGRPPMGALEERLDCIPSYHPRDVTDRKAWGSLAVVSTITNPRIHQKPVVCRRLEGEAIR